MEIVNRLELDFLTFKALILTSLFGSSTSSTSGGMAFTSKAVYLPFVVIAILSFEEMRQINKWNIYC